MTASTRFHKTLHQHPSDENIDFLKLTNFSKTSSYIKKEFQTTNPPITNFTGENATSAEQASKLTNDKLTHLNLQSYRI